MIEKKERGYLFQAILDTVASRCYVDPKALPPSCYEATQEVSVYRLNGQETTPKRLKMGSIILNKEKCFIFFLFL